MTHDRVTGPAPSRELAERGAREGTSPAGVRRYAASGLKIDVGR
jgi:hypothetical protein